MDISGIGNGSQAQLQASREITRLEIKSKDLVSWEDFQAQVESQVQAQQDENSVDLVKKAEKVDDGSLKTGETKQAESAGDKGQVEDGEEAFAEQPAKAEAKSRIIDKVV